MEYNDLKSITIKIMIITIAISLSYLVVKPKLIPVDIIQNHHILVNGLRDTPLLSNV
jgi:hypothetical protein